MRRSSTRLPTARRPGPTRAGFVLPSPAARCACLRRGRPAYRSGR